MIRNRSHQQIPLAEFDWPFQVALDENNRWVKMSECIPWDELADSNYQFRVDKKKSYGASSTMTHGCFPGTHVKVYSKDMGNTFKP